MEFKEGDILELVDTTYPNGTMPIAAKLGAKVCVISSPSGFMGWAGEQYAMVWVVWLRDELSSTQHNGRYFVNQFKKVEGDVSKYVKEFFKEGSITNLIYLASMAGNKSNE